MNIRVDHPVDGLVSVVMPAFNSSKYIRETIESVLGQTWKNIELLVVDDASSDSTVDVVREMAASDPRVRLFVQSKNCGAAVARNIALQEATGQFIAFLDADDLWRNDKIARQVRFMNDNHAAFSFTAYGLIDADGRSLGKVIDKDPLVQVGYRDMLKKKATLGCSTVMLDSTKVGRVQMPLIRTGQDYGLWLSLLKRGVDAKHLTDVLTSYRIVPGSISRNKFKKAKRQWEIYRKIEKLSAVDSAWCFLHYAWRAVSR